MENFSTAVTQGATSILIKALEDSKWFVPIERENIGNLLQERNLIRSTQDKNIQKMLILVSLKFPYYMLEYYLKVVLFLMT
jgi:curli biogenesis system outer membrane secretion channel CsgG